MSERAWLTSHQQQLTQQISQQKLAHGLIISGVSGAGKSQLADWLAGVLACRQPEQHQDGIAYACGGCKNCQLMAAGNYPDHLSLIKEKANLAVDEIRQVNGFIQKTAQMSGNKTVIIHDAHLMTESAANALLKTLEEPSGQSYLLLLTSDVQRLLPTIISRSRVIDIRPAVGQKLNQLLATNTQDAFANLSHLSELQSAEKEHDYQQLTERFVHYLLYNKGFKELVLLITEQDDGVRWLEKLITSLVRHYHGWPVSLELNLLTLLKQGNIRLEHVVLWYKILLNAQKQLVELVQANKNLVVEQMLIEMQGAQPS